MKRTNKNQVTDIIGNTKPSATLVWDLQVDQTSVLHVTKVGGVVMPISKTPASAAATGTTGQIAWDASYIYICTSTDTWKRVAIATW